MPYHDVGSLKLPCRRASAQINSVAYDSEVLQLSPSQQQVVGAPPAILTPLTTHRPDSQLDLNFMDPQVTAGSSVSARPAPVPASSTIVGPDNRAKIYPWKKAKAFLKTLERSAGAFGPLRSVIDQFIEWTEAYESAINSHAEYEELRGELESLFEVLQRNFDQEASSTLTMSIQSLCESIRKELEFVRTKLEREKKKRALETIRDSDQIVACYRRIQGYLQRLSLNTDLTIWKIVDTQATDNRLNGLRPSRSAFYNSAEAADVKRGACTPGTRVDVLTQTITWVYSAGPGSVYWMSGMAGTGKTTISYSLCEELDKKKSLAASFFCSRLLPNCRNANLIMPSIAYQIARFSHPFRCALSYVLEEDPDVHARLPHIQFKSLIVKPLSKVANTLPSDLVVVIDALDECENKESTGRILEVLLSETERLPIKFFLSTRPEPEIRARMSEQADEPRSSRLVLHELDKTVVQADIETYLREALRPISPLESQVGTLVERAGILFIYAATAVRYIGPSDPSINSKSRLKSILNASKPSSKFTVVIVRTYPQVIDALVKSA